MPSFCAAQNVGTRPLPCTVSFCHSHTVDELIRLSARLSLHFGLAVNLRVDLPVMVGCLKLIRLSERLSHMSRRLSCRLSGSLSWSLAQPGGSNADKHTPRPGTSTLLMN